MLQLKNETPFKAALAVLPDRKGIDTLHVIVKATLMLKPRLALAPAQVPVTMADEYYDDPATSSLKLASDLHIGKPGTDVLLVGSAHAPEGAEVAQSLVSLSAAGRSRQALVFGDRLWSNGGGMTAPQPFASMPLVWERAFGGVHVLPDKTLAEERNPIGIGFRGNRSAAEMAGQPVPNLEDPQSRLSSAGDIGVPVCFAPSSPAWLPRRVFAGTYDAAWQRTRAPYLPDDFDPRFMMSAAPEFSFESYLVGGEPFELAGVHPEGPITFSLPSTPLDIAVSVAGSPEHPPVNLETVLIAPDANLLCLTWRATVPVDRKALKVETVDLSLKARQAAA